MPPQNPGQPIPPEVLAEAPMGRAFDPSKATPGTTVKGVDPNSLQAGRPNLAEPRLRTQEQLIKVGTTRHTPIKVTKDGVIYDGNRGTRAAIEAGKPIDVQVIGEVIPGHGPVQNLPITPR